MGILSYIFDRYSSVEEVLMILGCVVLRVYSLI